MVSLLKMCILKEEDFILLILFLLIVQNFVYYLFAVVSYF